MLLTAGSAVAASVDSALGSFSATLPIASWTRPSESSRLRWAGFMSPGGSSEDARLVWPTAATRSWLICDCRSVEELLPWASVSKKVSALPLASCTMPATSRL